MSSATQNDNSDKPDQVNRSFLREHFLKTMNYLNGNNCKISMYDNTEVSCIYKMADAHFENIAVEDLHTPTGQKLEKAILRKNDVLSISFTLHAT